RTRDSSRKERVKRTVAIQTSQKVPGCVTDAGEGTADENTAIRLHEDCPDWSVHARPWVERSVDRAISIQPSDAWAADIIDHREIAPNDQFAVLLQCQGINDAVRAEPGIKR